jgi:hypothetical protein
MRIRKSLRPLLVAAAVSVGALAASTSAMAAAPTGDYADFKYCPYTNTAVQSCLYSKSTSGSFTLGNATVPLSATSPSILQGGFSFNDDATTTWFNAVGADTLVKTPMKVPGGLLGLVSTGGFTGWLIDAFNAAVAAGNDVYATAELVGPVKFNFLNFLIAQGTAVELPIRVHLENPFLGPSCYIGSSSNPVRLKLTTGTTAPPAGTAPLTGSTGSTTTNSDGTVATVTNVKLVDNTFSVPAASNCGYLPLDKILITLAVNAKEGLPAAAGKNSAILIGTNKQGDRAAVQASVQ